MPSYQRDTGLVSAVKSLEDDIEDIKDAQYMGKDVVTMNTFASGSSYDFTCPSFGFIATNVSYTTDNQANPNGWVFFDVFRGSVGSHAIPESFDLAIQDTNFDVNDFELRWLINLTNNDAGTLYVKAYVVASDSP